MTHAAASHGPARIRWVAGHMYKAACVMGLAVSGFPATTSQALARDVTGIYVATFPGAVTYYNITDDGGQLTGYFENVQIDPNAADGVVRTLFRVSGREVGSRLLLTISGPRNYEWTADLTGAGFTVNLPLESGQIQEAPYRRSSIGDVNQLVADIARSGMARKSTSDTLNALTKAQGELADDLRHRPAALAAVQRAKAELGTALASQQEANRELASRKAIAAQKHQAADAARASATTTDELVNASSLSADASSADADVSSAQAGLISAQINGQVEARALNQAEAYLRKLDAEVTQLREIIARYTTLLGGAK